MTHHTHPAKGINPPAPAAGAPATTPRPAAKTPSHRPPYVGHGADGARRSADIDRSEADTVTTGSPRWHELQASANRWDAQAADLDPPPPTVAVSHGRPWPYTGGVASSWITLDAEPVILVRGGPDGIPGAQLFAHHLAALLRRHLAGEATARAQRR